MSNQIIFQKTLIYQNQTFQAFLTQKELIWQDDQQKYILQLDDVVGLSKISEITEKGLFSFTVNSYPIIKGKRSLREDHFSCLNQADQTEWIEAINQIINSTITHLQIIVNPVSGVKKYQAILQEICTLFEKSNLDFSIELPPTAETTRNFIKQLNLTEIDGLVIVGGDGTIHDIINVLMSRKDREKVLEIPLGIIPSGTGNGLCKSILEKAGEPYNILNAAWLIVKGETQTIDSILTKQNNHNYYSLLSLAWGLISDVDLESEKLRFLGALRNDIYAIIRIIFLRSYKGRLTFTPHRDCKISEKIALLKQDKSYIIESEFILLWAMNVPWASYKIQPTPEAKLNDGAIDLLLVRKGVSRLELFKAFLLIDQGKHLDLPGFEYYKVTSFNLEPLTEKGILAVDGERVNYSPISMEIKQGLVKFFG